MPVPNSGPIVQTLGDGPPTPQGLQRAILRNELNTSGPGARDAPSPEEAQEREVVQRFDYHPPVPKLAETHQKIKRDGPPASSMLGDAVQFLGGKRKSKKYYKKLKKSKKSKKVRKSRFKRFSHKKSRKKRR